jgi:hypothetical protein
MRGSPLLRALFAFLVIASLGWPLWQLTREEVSAAPAPKPVAAAVKKAIGLHLTFTTVPKSFSVKHLDEEVWKETAPQGEMEKSITLDYPPEGIDLQFHIEWPDDVPASAMRVRLTDPGGDVHEKSLWGKGATDDVLTFP